MDFKQEITRLKRVVYFLNRTSTTITNNLVTTLVALTDVSIYEPSNGDVLIYNSTTELWENGPQTGGTTSTTSDVLIDCGTFTAPNENLLIDCGSFI